MNKHTPGPWHIGVAPGPIIYGPKGEQVADMFVPMLQDAEHRANARLIASAPALLAMLEMVTNDFSIAVGGDEYPAIIQARALIAQIKGE
jgi:hypothetical protein